MAFDSKKFAKALGAERDIHVISSAKNFANKLLDWSNPWGRMAGDEDRAPENIFDGSYNFTDANGNEISITRDDENNNFENTRKLIDHAGADKFFNALKVASNSPETNEVVSLIQKNPEFANSLHNLIVKTPDALTSLKDSMDPNAEGGDNQFNLGSIKKLFESDAPIAVEARNAFIDLMDEVAANPDDDKGVSYLLAEANNIRRGIEAQLDPMAIFHRFTNDPSGFLNDFLPNVLGIDILDMPYGGLMYKLLESLGPGLGGAHAGGIKVLAELNDTNQIFENEIRAERADALIPDIEVAKDAETQEVVASVGKDLTDQIDNNFNVFEIRVIENVLHNNVTAHLGDHWDKARKTGGIVDQVELSKMKRHVAGETQAIDSTTLSNQFAQYAEERLATLDRTTPAGQAEAKALEKMNITPHQAQIIRDRAVNSIERLEPAFAQAASPVQPDQPALGAEGPSAGIDTTAQVGNTGLTGSAANNSNYQLTA